ncbi:hypothetical protein DMENIID0001_012430 [Sergentomyia squamirostris]
MSFGFSPISDRICCIRVKDKLNDVSLISVYAPTEDHENRTYEVVLRGIVCLTTRRWKEYFRDLLSVNDDSKKQGEEVRNGPITMRRKLNQGRNLEEPQSSFVVLQAEEDNIPAELIKYGGTRLFDLIYRLPRVVTGTIGVSVICQASVREDQRPISTTISSSADFWAYPKCCDR